MAANAHLSTLPSPSLRLLLRLPPADLQQPNYALYLSYPPPRRGKPAGRFQAHYDSKVGLLCWP